MMVSISNNSSIGLALVETNQDFLAEVAKAARPETSLWTCFFAGDPGMSRAWGGNGFIASKNITNVLDLVHNRDLNTYYSVASFKPDADGKTLRRKANFDRLLVLVIDDIKDDQIHGLASYVLETSPNNFQVGIFLDGSDEDCANIQLVDELVKNMTTKGFISGDKSGNNSNRYVRLPIGKNHKVKLGTPHSHQMKLWKPDVRVSLAEAALMLGIDLEEMRYEVEVRSKAAAEREEIALMSGDYITTETQAVKVSAAVKNIITGEDFHNSINVLAASYLGSGMVGGSVVNAVRAVMESSAAPRDERWHQRYNDIQRSVAGKENEYKRTVLSGDELSLASKKPILMLLGDPMDGLTPPDYLIDDLFEMNAYSLIYGPSGCGKSFVEIDMMCCVASGSSFHGHETQKMPCIYVAGEGHNGLKARTAAWQKHHGIALKECQIYTSIGSIQILNRETAVKLASELKAIIESSGQKIGLVVIDTLARNIGDGDENSAKDIGMFFNILDELIRLPYGCHISIVHHSGKDAAKGARGSSALRAAVDQEFEVEQTVRGKVTLTNHKMKEGATPPVQYFKVRVVDLGLRPNAKGVMKGVSSIVLEDLTEVERPIKVTGGKIVKKGESALTSAELIDFLIDGWTGYKDIEEHFNCSSKTVKSVIQTAVAMGFIKLSGRGYELTVEGRRQINRGPGGHSLAKNNT